MGGVILISRIQREVADHYGVDVATMVAPDGPEGSRCHEVSHPRQVAMALASRLTDHSLNRIGYFFGGRDHATVIHAEKAVAKRQRSDPALHKLMRDVTLGLVRR